VFRRVHKDRCLAEFGVWLVVWHENLIAVFSNQPDFINYATWADKYPISAKQNDGRKGIINPPRNRLA
jgi:hypothetical protein